MGDTGMHVSLNIYHDVSQIGCDVKDSNMADSQELVNP